MYVYLSITLIVNRNTLNFNKLLAFYNNQLNQVIKYYRDLNPNPPKIYVSCVHYLKQIGKYIKKQNTISLIAV